jgi:hypothetical protein
VLWWVVASGVAVALLVWLFVLSGRAGRRKRTVAAAPMQTPGILAPGPLTVEAEDEEPE